MEGCHSKNWSCVTLNQSNSFMINCFNISILGDAQDQWWRLSTSTMIFASHNFYGDVFKRVRGGERRGWVLQRDSKTRSLVQVLLFHRRLITAMRFRPTDSMIASLLSMLLHLLSMLLASGRGVAFQAFDLWKWERCHRTIFGDLSNDWCLISIAID